MYDSIALSGAGPKGFCCMGVAKACKELGYLKNVKYYSGTSAGSFIASGLAMEKEPIDLAKGVESGIRELHEKGYFNSISQFQVFVQRYGLIETDGFMDIILDNANIPNMTFSDVLREFERELSITATCVNTRQLEVFDVANNPDMSIRTAIKASCAIPFIFTPILYNGKTYVDGSVSCHVPHEIVNGRKLVVNVSMTSFEDTKYISDLKSFAFGVMECSVNRYFFTSFDTTCDVIEVPYDGCMGMLEFIQNVPLFLDGCWEEVWKGEKIVHSRKNVVKKASTMQVQKRNGMFEDVSFDKILRRVKNLTNPPPEDHLPNLAKEVDDVKIAQKVIQSLYNKVHTSELDELSAETAVSYATVHPDYGKLASRIVISNLHKETSKDVLDIANMMHEKGVMADDCYEVIKEHQDLFNMELDYGRDYLFDYFGFKTLEKSYLFRHEDKIAERPQHMWLRVAIGIHGNDLPAILETYHGMSTLKFTHATPTLFNAGTVRPQMSSCFLLRMDDSIAGIYKGLADCAQISKFCGGIGMSVSNIRAKDSYIKGTNGFSSGIVPMLKVFNDTARYVNQSGRRLGSFAMYIEPWHYDIYEFLDMRKNTGADYERARDLFYAIWVPDLFMERVRDDGMWSLFSPDTAPGLVESHGDEFRSLYEKYESEKRYKKQVSAQSLWFKILESQIETGTPYIGFKDSVNAKTNQMNLGTVQNSNLCHEITQYSSPEEVAVCNLASLCLPSFVLDGKYDFETLRRTVRTVVRNLDNVIDRNFYPVPEAKVSNMKHRPVGLGVQGLANVYAILRMPWDSEDAKRLNKEIFQNIYFAAVSESNKLAIERGKYSSFDGSPASQGKLQYHLWGVYPEETPYLDWTSLENAVKSTGLRNSLLVALMPTASTGQIMGNNECIEPFTSNIYVRRVLSGEFIVVNQYLVQDLLDMGLWNEKMKNRIIAANGSVQNIKEIPDDIKKLYRTVWELSMRSVIDQAADRGAYVCQSQSLNLWIPNDKLNFKSLSSMHVYNWKSGNKGMYYLRTQPASEAAKFTVDHDCLACQA